jgi:hypothetical protein
MCVHAHMHICDKSRSFQRPIVIENSHKV